MRAPVRGSMHDRLVCVYVWECEREILRFRQEVLLIPPTSFPTPAGSAACPPCMRHSAKSQHSTDWCGRCLRLCAPLLLPSFFTPVDLAVLAEARHVVARRPRQKMRMIKEKTRAAFPASSSLSHQRRTNPKRALILCISTRIHPRTAVR